MPPDKENHPLIGPDGYQSEPSMLMDEARERIHEEDAKNKESVKLARRLFIAMILITILGVVFYIVLPYYGIRLSPTVPILSFLAIFAGAILTAIEEGKNNDHSDDTSDESCCNNDGCPTGMCGGPRPLQMFRDKKPPKR
jgi:hypothetical protein